MTDSIAKKLGAVIAPVEGGMPETLRADPDVQSALLSENSRLRADLAAERQKAFTAMRVFERYRELEATITKLREALERAERKLTAYVGVCKDDKELTDAVLPMVRAALEETGGDSD